MPDSYDIRELMVAAAAREIRDGEVVFVGMRLPMLAFFLARRTHAPGAVGIFENGVVRDGPAAAPVMTMSDTPNVAEALWCGGMLEAMSLLQRGEVDVGFIGGAEVDRFGNVNSSYIGDPTHPAVKLPGSGGGADIASLARRLLLIMPHERRRLSERVGFVTSPGNGEGTGWRRRVGLPGGGPSALITSMAVFRFDPGNGEGVLESWHPGFSIRDVQRETGWTLEVSSDARPTPPPTVEELAVIRELDPDGAWTRGRSPVAGSQAPRS
ncbi:MAG TPA: CoA-transferase [Actinomycetota bacterium]|nr:CoA-transferase [Actinomycetota bacterium]